MVLEILLWASTAVVVMGCAVAVLGLLWVCKQIWYQVFPKPKRLIGKTGGH